MTTSEKAQVIVDCVRSYANEIRADLAAVRIKLAGERAMEQEWNREARDEIDFTRSTNPHTYQVERLTKEVDQLFTRHQQYEAALDLAISHFLSMIPNEEEKIC